MIESRRFPPIFWLIIIVSPLLIMGVLTITVLLPTLKDPNSKIYSSSLGYPSLKRLVGQPIKVESVAVGQQQISTGLAASGESIALEEVTFGPLVSGTVRSIEVKEGAWVRQGQPLLKIEAQPFEERVETARNNLADAESTLSKLSNTYEKKVAELTYRVKTAQQQLKITQNQNQLSPDVYREKVARLQTSLKVSEEKLAVAKQRWENMQTLSQQGAIAQNQLLDAQETYLARQEELNIAQQNLALARSGQEQDSLTEQQSYATRKQELSDAQQELAQTRTNLAQDIATARIRVSNQKIALAQAIRSLEQTVLRASTDGLVSRVRVHVGEIANVQTPAFTLTENVVFKAFIDQARLNAVKVGDGAIVRLVAYPGQSFAGKVINLNPTVETDSGRFGAGGANRQYTYSAWIALESLTMPPGLQGYAEFGQTSVSMVIPESAVTHLSAGEGMVMVVEQGQGVIRRVKLGRRLENRREVLSGLGLGEQVVVTAKGLNPGDRLKVIASEGSNG